MNLFKTKVKNKFLQLKLIGIAVGLMTDSLFKFKK